MKKIIHKMNYLPFLFFGLVSCTLVNYSSSESYTVEGALSANTGIEFWTVYSPIDRSASACNYTGLGSGSREVRKAGDTIKVAAQTTAQTYKINIPRYMVRKGCKMEFINSRVVPMHTLDGIKYSSTDMGFSRTSIDNAYKNQRLSELNCSFDFEIKPSRGHPNTDIEKSLDCKIVTKSLIAGKVLPTNNFILNINITNQEKPAVETSWIKVGSGWKPCKGSIGDMAGYCGDSPNFRTFKHNGKTCTVYPSCTE